MTTAQDQSIQRLRGAGTKARVLVHELQRNKYLGAPDEVFVEVTPCDHPHGLAILVEVKPDGAFLVYGSDVCMEDIETNDVERVCALAKEWT